MHKRPTDDVCPNTRLKNVPPCPAVKYRLFKSMWAVDCLQRIVVDLKFRNALLPSGSVYTVLLQSVKLSALHRCSCCSSRQCLEMPLNKCYILYIYIYNIKFLFDFCVALFFKLQRLQRCNANPVTGSVRRYSSKERGVLFLCVQEFLRIDEK